MGLGIEPREGARGVPPAIFRHSNLYIDCYNRDYRQPWAGHTGRARYLGIGTDYANGITRGELVVSYSKRTEISRDSRGLYWWATHDVKLAESFS